MTTNVRNLCTIDGCEGRVVGRGYCRKHYTRWDRYGDPLYLKSPKRTLSEDDRFWSYVDKRGDDECWPWTGGTNRRGYGKCRHSASRFVHRVAFHLANGYLPETVDHDCHNRDTDCLGGDGDPHRLCCNPTHLVDRSAVDNAVEASRTRRLCRKGLHKVIDTGERWDHYRCRECYLAGRQRENERARAVRAETGPGRGRKPTQACGHGHPWVEGSFAVYSGQRQCLACRKRRNAEQWQRKKAAREAAAS